LQVEPDAANACQMCFVTNACDVERACAGSSACDATHRCEATCATFDCNDDCLVSNGYDPTWPYEADAGDSIYVAQAKVVTGTCASACGVGANWECVGRQSWSTPQSTNFTYHMTIKDYATSAVEPGLDVYVCDLNDEACSQYIQKGTTDATGTVVLTFSNAISNVGGSTETGLDGFLKIVSPSIVTTYYYWGYPFSAASVFTYFEVLTPDEQQSIWTPLGVNLPPIVATLQSTPGTAASSPLGACRLRSVPRMDKRGPSTPWARRPPSRVSTAFSRSPTCLQATS
jgi:hypothetical protein